LGDGSFRTFSRTQSYEAKWNDSFLATLALMVLGLLAIIVLTYRVPRNSSGFAFKMFAFMVYEVVLFGLFVAHYMKGLYLQA